jgi:6-phosphofructokinase 1
LSELNFGVSSLGECHIPSPMSGAQFVKEKEHVLYHTNLSEIESFLNKGMQPPRFEMAGPRDKIFFDPSHEPLLSL